MQGCCFQDVLYLWQPMVGSGRSHVICCLVGKRNCLFEHEFFSPIVNINLFIMLFFPCMCMHERGLCDQGWCLYKCLWTKKK